MIYCGAQLDIRVKTFACRNLPESSLFNSEGLYRFSDLCEDPNESLWPFVFVMDFIFQQRASQYIINIYRTSESTVMAVRICVGIPIPLSSVVIHYGALSDIRVKTFARRNFSESSFSNSECLNRFAP